MKKDFHMTQKGIDELKTELDALMSNRVNIAEAVNTAREQGDLRENAEYQNARLEQERAEKRMSEIDHILKNVDVINKPKTNDKVVLGSTVELKDGSKTKTFTVVGTVEADPTEGKVSDQSPIGASLMGKAVGDKVEIKLPSETKSYSVKSIS